jgi:hypothetical protein
MRLSASAQEADPGFFGSSGSKFHGAKTVWLPTKLRSGFRGEAGFASGCSIFIC